MNFGLKPNWPHNFAFQDTVEFTCFQTCSHTVKSVKRKLPGYGKFYQPPPFLSKYRHLLCLSQKCELLFGGGRWAFRFVSLSLCHGWLIAFRWYLPVSIPYLLRRTPSVYSCCEEAHTCVHLLSHRYHPGDSSIRRSVYGCSACCYHLPVRFVISFRFSDSSMVSS